MYDCNAKLLAMENVIVVTQGSRASVSSKYNIDALGVRDKKVHDYFLFTISDRL